MTSIGCVTLEVADPTAASTFYTTAFGLDTRVRVQASEAPTAGFRGFTLNIGVSQPATVNGLIGTALDAGATPLKPATKQFWGGYSGVVQAPDATIWKVATASKNDAGPATRQIDGIALLLGVADVAASKRFTLTAALPWRRAMAPSSSRSPLHPVPSSWCSTGAMPPPRTPASLPTAPDRTGS